VRPTVSSSLRMASNPCTVGGGVLRRERTMGGRTASDPSTVGDGGVRRPVGIEEMGMGSWDRDEPAGRAQVGMSRRAEMGGRRPREIDSDRSAWGWRVVAAVQGGGWHGGRSIGVGGSGVDL
jgi:hypothetical protein